MSSPPPPTRNPVAPGRGNDVYGLARVWSDKESEFYYIVYRNYDCKYLLGRTKVDPAAQCFDV